MKHIATLIGLTSSLVFGWSSRRERREGSLIQAGLIITAGCLVMMASVAGCDSGSNQPTQAPSVETAAPGAPQALDGATLLEARCSVCHSADKPRQAQKSRLEWEETIARMIGKGAKLTEAEKKAVIDFLSNR